jgi:preprotein translocase subunit SecD
MAPRTALALFGILANGFAQSASIASSAPAAPVTLAVHLLVACSGAGAGQPVKFPGVDPSLCLDRTPFLTHQDVRSAEIRRNSQGQFVVFLTLHEDAAIRELRITRQNIGNRVAIAVNGRVAMAPTIAASSRFVYLQANYTEKQARALVESFNRQAGNR